MVSGRIETNCGEIKRGGFRGNREKKEGMVHLPENHLYKLSRFTRQIRDE
jgi:hypothetical protein